MIVGTVVAVVGDSVVVDAGVPVGPVLPELLLPPMLPSRFIAVLAMMMTATAATSANAAMVFLLRILAALLLRFIFLLFL